MATQNINDDDFEKGLKKISEQFGKGYNTRGLADPHPKAVPTGHEDLDVLLTKGAHGIYLGGIIEIFGSESSGKSSLALRTVGNAQKLGHRCCWLDAEAGFDENIAILNGCDPTQLVLPDLIDTRAADKTDGLSLFNVAEVLEIMYRSVQSNLFGLVVLDSVAGLIPERVLESNFDPNSAGIAEVARALSSMLGKIAQACKKTETSCIFINQKRDQPGAYFQNPNHTPGGKALKFFAHQRISVEKIGGENGQVWADVDGRRELIGHYAKTKIVKNKKAPPVPPGVEIEIPIYYREYFPDDAKRCYDLARSLQVITIRNGVLTWKEGEEIVLRAEGESMILQAIREKQMEPQLADACVRAEKSEKNASKKSAIKVPPSIKELSVKYNTPVTVAESKTETRPKRGRKAALDLDDEK